MGELTQPSGGDAPSSSSSSSSSSPFASFYYSPPSLSASSSSSGDETGEDLGQLTLRLKCDRAGWEGRKSNKTAEEKPRRTLLVLVVDQSGSMSGALERQVVPALNEIVGESFDLPQLECEVVMYHSQARRLQLKKKTYQSTINKLRATGGTSFNSAFDEIGKLLQEKINEFDDFVVGFLTDGQDNTGKDSQQYHALKTLIRRLGKPVIVHALAFTQYHDFDFLNTIRRDLGTTEGGFQYAEPSDGQDVLKNKLRAIFDAVSLRVPSIEITVSMPGFEFVSDDESTASSELKKTVPLREDNMVEVIAFTKKSSSSYSSFSFSGSTGEEQEVTVVATMDDPDVPEVRQVFRVKVKQQNKGETALSGLRRVANWVEALQKKIAEAATNGTVTEEGLQEWASKLEKLRGHMKKFHGVPMLTLFKKSQRAEVFESVNKVTAKLDKVLELIVQLKKDKVLSTAMKARLAELTYGHQFERASRERRLNERAERNANLLVEAEKAVEEVVIDRASVDKISDDLAEHYRCILTQSNWKELISEDEKDIVGFGLAVSRPEVAVDDPTQVRIVDISITPVSHSSFEDALRYSISTVDHIAAHGGFSHGEGEFGVAMKGSAREPINAWVPLFIHPEHWKVVFPQIKGILGYLATLDPLGYNPNQVDLFYLILATMVSRISATPGEKELELIFALQRTCIALTRDFPHAEEKFIKLVEAFASKPEARLKDQTKNLLVLVGYMLSLPASTVERTISGSREWLLFWMRILNESVRRTSESICRSLQEEKVDAIITAMVTAENPLPAEQVAQHLFCSPSKPYENRVATGAQAQAGSKKDAVEEEATAADPSPQSTPVPTPAPQVTLEDIVPNPEQDEEVRQMARLLMYGARDSSLPELTEERARLRVSDVNKTMLDELLLFGKYFLHRGHPSFAGLISLATFTHSWLSLQNNAGGMDVLLEAIDNNGGVAPNSWITATKQAFKERSSQPATFLSCIKAFESATGCELQSVAYHDWFVVVRAMIAQGVSLRVNKDCREAIEQGSYLDPIVDSERVLEKYFTEMLTKHEKQLKNQSRNNQIRYAIKRCVETDDIALFVGYLVSRLGFEGKRNTQAFRELYLKFQHFTDASSIPLGAEKLKILLTGKWAADSVTVNVLDGGKAWQPGQRRTKKKYRNNVHRFERVWGAAFTNAVSNSSE